MTNLYTVCTECRLCGSSDLVEAVPMEPLPLATPVSQYSGFASDDPVFREAIPLSLHLCKACGCLQVLHVCNRELQYPNYVYTTTSSLGLPDHFIAYAQEVVEKWSLKKKGLAIEIGSNDGVLLRAFKQQGFTILGIDPARDIAAHATEQGVPTLPEFFEPDIAAQILHEYGEASIILSNNVIANIDNMQSFIQAITSLLASDGIWISETQYGVDVVEHNLIETIYHEHLCYFNVKPLVTYYDRHGLQIIDVTRIPTKGGSIRVTAQRHGGPHKLQTNVAEQIIAEQNGAYHTLIPYQKLTANIAEIRQKLNDLIDQEHQAGYQVAGYGMSVGTISLLAQFGLQQKIVFLVDDAPEKEAELRGPDYVIPLRSKQALLDERIRMVVIFAWRYTESIMSNNTEYVAAGGRFIVPLPQISIR